jgi:hypothetical protein
VQRHSQTTTGGGIARFGPGFGVRLADLLANPRAEIGEGDSGQRGLRLRRLRFRWLRANEGGTNEQKGGAWERAR